MPSKKYPCPHCRRATIPRWRRLLLGPALPTRCSSCDRRVGVPWWSIVWSIPAGVIGWAVATVLFARYQSWISLTRELLYIGGLLVVFFLFMTAWLRWVPLVRR